MQALNLAPIQFGKIGMKSGGGGGAASNSLFRMKISASIALILVFNFPEAMRSNAAVAAVLSQAQGRITSPATRHDVLAHVITSGAFNATS